MRSLAVLSLALLLLAPGVVAEDATVIHHGCEEDPDSDTCHDHDAPSVGVLATVGLLGALALAARRRA